MPALTLAIAAVTRFSCVALLAGSLAACGVTSSLAGPHSWTTTAALPDGTTQEVVIRDESGLLTNAEVDPAGVQPVMGIENPSGEANVVLVPWASGSCDVKTEFVFRSSAQGGLAGTVATTTSGEICDMMAIEHSLRLTANAPLPAAQVTLNPAP